MLDNSLKASLIISSSIIFSAFVLKVNANYHYETHGDRMGFTVKVDRNTGQRCLVQEGAVRVIGNWREMANSYPVPLNLCKE
jgi:hypothetical protein